MLKKKQLVTAGLTGIRATGQGATMLAPTHPGFVDQTAKANENVSKHMTDLAAEHMAGYMKNDAPRHGLAPLPPRAVEPNWKKGGKTSGGQRA